MSRILCVEDDAAILRLLTVVLAADAHQLVAATTAAEAMEVVARGDLNAILLDLGLPDRDGLELLVAILAACRVPVIVVSARDAVSEKVAALDLGATDYVTKPFDGEELRARLRVALRQNGSSTNGDGAIEHADIRMVPSRHEAFLSGRALALTPREYALLQALVEARGRILTHTMLLERVWGEAHREDVEYLRVAIRSLRRKIEADPAAPLLVRNEPGIGYRLA